MKRMLLILPVLLFISNSAFAVKWAKDTAVAVLEFDVPSAAAYGAAEKLANSYEDAFVNNGRYLIVERSSLDTVLSEQELTMSGFTSGETELGALTGAEKVIIGSVARSGDRYNLTIQGVDVASGVIEVSDTVYVATLSELDSVIEISVERFVKKSRGKNVAAYVPEAENTEDTTSAAQTDDEDDTMPAYQRRIYDDLLKMADEKYYVTGSGQYQFQSSAYSLDFTYRKKLFREARLSIAGGVILNVVPSLGSWIQKDFTGALIIDAFVAGGLLLVTSESGVVRGMGFSLAVAGYGYGFYRAGEYAVSYNKSLRDNLSITRTEIEGLGNYAMNRPEASFSVSLLQIQF